ncbi:MAG: N-formylglutamate amidohydrolase [Candidatus Marinimicrobia bacterium]|nr:N-formylglutamate amidohydrolase [Candidatus Neomarinimicrobiota bacterium]
MKAAYPFTTSKQLLVAPLEVLEPQLLRLPIVFASPHSGSYYPESFVNGSLLSLGSLRKSEDCYVDELFSSVPELGAPLLRAIYSRAFIDLNREPYELDPAMFSDPLPKYANTTSARVAAGLGTIARIVATHSEIYHRKLTYADAEYRINEVYKPYHTALEGLIRRATKNFGLCLLIDCHSMPSKGLPLNTGLRTSKIDFVLGDRCGLSCSKLFIDTVEDFLENKGYRVIRNNPYAGGYTTQHYGDPANGIHAIQIEINRSIYMEENTLQRKPAFLQIKEDIQEMTKYLADFTSQGYDKFKYQRQSAE